MLGEHLFGKRLIQPESYLATGKGHRILSLFNVYCLHNWNPYFVQQDRNDAVLLFYRSQFQRRSAFSVTTKALTKGQQTTLANIISHQDCLSVDLADSKGGLLLFNGLRVSTTGWGRAFNALFEITLSLPTELVLKDRSRTYPLKRDLIGNHQASFNWSYGQKRLKDEWS